MKRVIALLAAAAFFAPAAGATVIRSATLDETIEWSAAIVVGRVLAESPLELPDGRILTAVRVRVEEGLAGPYGPGDTIEVSRYGGTWGGRTATVPGAARYARGERVLLQLEEIDGRLHALGLAAGKWTVVEDEVGARQLVRSLAGLGLAGSALMTEGPVALDEFRALVESVRGGSDR